MSKSKLIFAGTPEFALPTLTALIAADYQIVAVYTQPDRPAGRGQKISASPAKRLALQHNLTIEQPLTLKTAEAEERLKQYGAQAMIVVAYGLILPQEVLNFFPDGCINVHASLLPRWRGAAPIQRAILAGDKITGVSIMQMQTGLDTGPVFSSADYPIDSNDTAQILHDKLMHLGAKTLIDVLPDILAHSIISKPQNENLATYAKKLNKNEAEIKWINSAIEIHRCTKAFNPWPVAFTHLDNFLIRIWDSEILSEKTPQEFATEKPGTIVGFNQINNGIIVATGAGLINILQLQFPGGKILPVKEILNARGHLFQPGNQFV